MNFLGMGFNIHIGGFLFGLNLDWGNTHSTISKAKEHIEHDKQTNIINKIRAEFKKM